MAGENQQEPVRLSFLVNGREFINVSVWDLLALMHFRGPVTAQEHKLFQVPLTTALECKLSIPGMGVEYCQQYEPVDYGDE